MDMVLNPFKRAIKAGKLQVGLWSSLSSHLTVEVIAGSGFDWLLLDTEHSPNELPMVHSQLQAAVGGSAHPVVRPPWNDPVVIKRFLDIGTQSFLDPLRAERGGGPCRGCGDALSAAWHPRCRHHLAGLAVRPDQGLFRASR